jgi:hypothetical protein
MKTSIALGGILVPLLMGCGSEPESRGLLKSGVMLVRVNELQPSRNSEYVDPDAPGEYPDWIELYNAGPRDAHLEGCFITDNPSRPFKHMLLPEVVVPAKGFLVLFADSRTSEGPLHLSFNLSGGGEAVELRGTDGNLVDGAYYAAASPMPPLPADPDHTCLYSDRCNRSFARFPDGSGPFAWGECPTPDGPNETTCAVYD